MQALDDRIFFPENILFFIYILARVSGLFLVSPLLSNKGFTALIRISISLFTTVCIGIALYPKHHELTNTPWVLDPMLHYYQEVVLITIAVIKEISIGYLIGFCFNILFEGVLLAGELIDTMIGFNMAQFIDPITLNIRSLLSQLFTIMTMLILLSLDIHHVFFRVLADSFNLMPLGTSLILPSLFNQISSATSLIFIFGLKIAAFPFTVLSLSTISIAFMNKSIPEFNPLITGVSLRILIGLFTLIGVMNLVPTLVESAFSSLNDMVASLIKTID